MFALTVAGILVGDHMEYRMGMVMEGDTSPDLECHHFMDGLVSPTCSHYFVVFYANGEAWHESMG